MDNEVRKYENLFKTGEYVAAFGQQGFIGAGRILDWDAHNHQLLLATSPRYLMSSQGWIKNNQAKKVHMQFDPTGHRIEHIRANEVREYNPVNQAIELKGRVISANQGKYVGILETVDQNYFGLNPHIGSNLQGKPQIINTNQIIPIQGTILEQNPHSLDEIVDAMTSEPKIIRS